MSLIVNIVADPTCSKSHANWQCTATQDKTTGLWTYTPTGANTLYTMSIFDPWVTVGEYVAYVYANNIPSAAKIGTAKAENGTTLSRSATRLIQKIALTDPADTRIQMWMTAALSFTPIYTGLYTFTDWTRLQDEYGLDYFDSSVMPLV